MMKRFNRMDRKGVLHYITLNVREKMKAFSRDEYARAILRQLHEQCIRHPAKLIAYVIMPEHLHAILNPRDGRINHFLSQFKSAASLTAEAIAHQYGHPRILQWLANTPDGHRQFLQDGKHDFHLYSDRLIWQKINYIHNNPIKRGLVQHAEDYLYSSFAPMYKTGKEVIVPIDEDWWWDLGLE